MRERDRKKKEGGARKEVEKHMDRVWGLGFTGCACPITNTHMHTRSCMQKRTKAYKASDLHIPLPRRARGGEDKLQGGKGGGKH